MCTNLQNFHESAKDFISALYIEVGEIWVGICRGIKRSREIFFLEAVLNLLRNNIIIASRYVPAILSPCLASRIPCFLSIARY